MCAAGAPAGRRGGGFAGGAEGWAAAEQGATTPLGATAGAEWWGEGGKAQEQGERGSKGEARFALSSLFT